MDFQIQDIFPERALVCLSDLQVSREIFSVSVTWLKFIFYVHSKICTCSQYSLHA